MRSYAAFLRYELLMHLRSWRLWVCLGALVAVAVPWRLILSVRLDTEAIDQLAAGYFQFAVFFAILFVPVLILLSVDAVARVRASGVQSVLFTKPFSVLSFVLSGWTAVVVTAVVVVSIVVLARHLGVRHLIGLRVYLAPMGWLLLLGALPMAMIAAAIAMWIRTIFNHNVVAYVASAAALFGLLTAARILDLPILGWNEKLYAPLLQNYIPEIGRDLEWRTYSAAFLNTLLLSLLFLSFSCYHMRRQEPQRAVLGSYGRKWSDMPTFVHFLADLRIDRRVGPSAHLLFASTLLVGGLTVHRSAVEGRTMSVQRQRWAVEIKQELREQAPETPGARIRHYAGDVRIEGRRKVSCDLRMDVENTTQTALSRIALKIPFGMEVSRFEGSDGAALQTARWGNVFLVDLPSPLDRGATATIRLAYAGCPKALKIGGLLPFSTKYSVASQPLETAGISIRKNYLRLTSWILPRSLAIEKRADGMHAVEAPRLFTANLDFAVFGDLEVISPHGRIEPRNRDGTLARSRIEMTWPREDFLLFAGEYEHIERRFGPLALRTYFFPSDREAVEFALFELNETCERWGKVLGPSQGAPYTLVETPFVPAWEQGMPAYTLYSGDLDSLNRYMPYFGRRNVAGTIALSRFNTILSTTLAGTIIQDSFHPVREITPLKRALYFYLLGTVSRSELGPGARANPLLFGKLARAGSSSEWSRHGHHHHRGGWSMGRGRHGGPSYGSNGSSRSSDSSAGRSYLDSRAVMLQETPLVERMKEPGFDALGALHPWRMLHYLMEDDKFAEFLGTLMRESRSRLMGLEDIQEIAVRVLGEPLDWFFDHWFLGSGVPKYEVRLARADMFENPRTRDVEYDVEIEVENKGRGRMPVPVVLLTDQDVITREVWLDSASTQGLTLRVPDRPQMVFVDPEGWILQEAFRDKETGARGVARRKVKIVE